MTKTIAYHPWEDILEELEARWRTQSQFAELLGISRFEVNNLIKGRRNITARLAARIGSAFGTSAEVRLGLQNLYDLYLVQQNKKESQAMKRIHKESQQLELA